MTGFGSAIASFCEDMGNFLINSIVRIYTSRVTLGYKKLVFMAYETKTNMRNNLLLSARPRT
jgi:hypothetical protein